MIKHFGLSQETADQLKLTNQDLFKALAFFDPHGTEHPVDTSICLMYYIDTRGDFMSKRDKFDLLAFEMFNNLDTQDKLAVAQYVDWEDEDED